MDFMDEDPFVFQKSYPHCNNINNNNNNNNHSSTFHSGIGFSVISVWDLFFGHHHFGRRCFGMFEFHKLLPIDWYNLPHKNGSGYNNNAAAVVGIVTLLSLLLLHTFRYINLKSSKNVLCEFLRLSKKDVSLFGGTAILIYILFSLFSENVTGYLYIMKFEVESFQHTFGEMIKGLAVILLYRMQVLIALSKISRNIRTQKKEAFESNAIDVYSCFIEIPWMGVIVLIMMGLFFPSSSFLNIVLLAWGSLISVVSVYLFCYATVRNTGSLDHFDLLDKHEDASPSTQTNLLDSEKKKRKKKKPQNLKTKTMVEEGGEEGEEEEEEEEEEEQGEERHVEPAKKSEPTKPPRPRNTNSANQLFDFDLNLVSTILQWFLVFHAWYITFVIQQLGKTTNLFTFLFFAKILSGILPYILVALIYIPSTISLLPFCTHILNSKIKTQ